MLRPRSGSCLLAEAQCPRRRESRRKYAGKEVKDDGITSISWSRNSYRFAPREGGCGDYNE